MSILNRSIAICTVLLTCYLLTACATLAAGDPKKTSSWKAPQRFSSSSVYDAALKAISRDDLEVVSHDRKTGVITVRKVIPLPLINIPSQVPISIVIGKTGGYTTLNTTAYLKGFGTADVYRQIINDFYDTLFAELNISRPEEKVVNKTGIANQSQEEKVVNKIGSSNQNQQSGGATIRAKAKPDVVVKEMQGLLNSLGYSAGAPDGLAGGKTRMAVSHFQKDNRLSVSGQLTPETIKSIRTAAIGSNNTGNSSTNLDELKTDDSTVGSSDISDSSINLDDIETDDPAVNLDAP